MLLFSSFVSSDYSCFCFSLIHGISFVCLLFSFHVWCYCYGSVCLFPVGLLLFFSFLVLLIEEAVAAAAVLVVVDAEVESEVEGQGEVKVEK